VANGFKREGNTIEARFTGLPPTVGEGIGPVGTVLALAAPSLAS